MGDPGELFRSGGVIGWNVMIARCLATQLTFEVGEKRSASSWCLVALIPAEILRFAQDDSTTVWFRGGMLVAHSPGAKAPLALRAYVVAEATTHKARPTRTHKALPANTDMGIDIGGW